MKMMKVSLEVLKELKQLKVDMDKISYSEVVKVLIAEYKKGR